jgi:hypothetical protein
MHWGSVLSSRNSDGRQGRGYVDVTLTVLASLQLPMGGGWMECLASQSTGFTVRLQTVEGTGRQVQAVGVQTWIRRKVLDRDRQGPDSITGAASLAVRMRLMFVCARDCH